MRAARPRSRRGGARCLVAARDRRRAAGRRHDGRQPVRVRESGRRHAARAVARRPDAGRRTRAGRPRVACRRPFFGVESFGAGTHARSGNLTAHGPRSSPGRLRSVAVGGRRQFRARRGFVRPGAVARKPFVWHIYPQADDVHLPKLDAALAHLSAGLADAPRAALERFWHAWNGVGTPDWADFWQHRAALDANAARWADALAAVGDLAGKLAEYAKSQLK